MNTRAGISNDGAGLPSCRVGANPVLAAPPPRNAGLSPPMATSSNRREQRAESVAFRLPPSRRRTGWGEETAMRLLLDPHPDPHLSQSHMGIEPLSKGVAGRRSNRYRVCIRGPRGNTEAYSAGHTDGGLRLAPNFKARLRGGCDDGGQQRGPDGLYKSGGDRSAERLRCVLLNSQVRGCLYVARFSRRRW